MQREHAQIMKITNGFFNPISAFAQTNLIIELKLTVYLFSKKLGTDQKNVHICLKDQTYQYHIWAHCMDLDLCLDGPLYRWILT
jgi:hypothetical protein